MSTTSLRRASAAVLGLFLLTMTIMAAATAPSARAQDSASVDVTRSTASQPFAYEPATVTVDPGATVTWSNPQLHTTGAAEDHPTNCRQGRSQGTCPWSTEALPPGGSFTVTFPESGTFAYYCLVHPYMEGTIVVGSGAPPAPEPSKEPEPEPTRDPDPEPSQDPDPTPEPTSEAPAPSASDPGEPEADPTTDDDPDAPAPDADDPDEAATDEATTDADDPDEATSSSTNTSSEDGDADDADLATDAAGAESDDDGSRGPVIALAVVLLAGAVAASTVAMRGRP